MADDDPSVKTHYPVAIQAKTQNFDASIWLPKTKITKN